VRYKVQRGSRLAASITYFAFLSLFPLLAIAVAITAAVLGQSGVTRLRDHINHSLPGLGDKVSVNTLVDNAATVGLISALLLVWSGLSWVNAARGCLRTMWAIEDNPGHFALRKLADLLSLCGLAVAAAVSLGASAITVNLATRTLRGIGLQNSAISQAVLWLVGTGLGLAASTLMFAYLLAGIPRLVVPHGVLARAAFITAVVFEGAKVLVATYLARVAGRSVYGAFGVPVALLLWFDLTFQLLLFLAAWTATRTEDALKG
jgi:membrane protein